MVGGACAVASLGPRGQEVSGFGEGLIQGSKKTLHASCLLKIGQASKGLRRMSICSVSQ